MLVARKECTQSGCAPVWRFVLLQGGGSAERCARERSECQSKDKGGDLGYKTRASLNREFCDVAFGEEPGKVYGPLETESGLHLIYLHSCREPDGQATFPEWMVKAGLAKNE